MASCHTAPEPGVVVVSAVGSSARVVDAARRSMTFPSRLATDAVAQGLVRFDAAGQVEPGLAERWIVTDGGMSYIFRLKEARWSDGSVVTASQVAQQLRRQIAPASRNPLKPWLSAIDDIVAMTPQVIEVRLSSPRPDLLKLFAQPELALVRLGKADGTGPMRQTGSGEWLFLRPIADPTRIDGDSEPVAVRLIGEKAANAIVRFAEGHADLVAGGGFADWPLVERARVPAAAIRIDPAAGLFGLAFVHRDGFLADTANRAAIAQAIDGAGTVGAVAPRWRANELLLPAQLDSAAPPASPAWTLPSPAGRLAAARLQIAAYGRPITLRIALPPGPGAIRLWGQLARGLLRVGIMPARVVAGQPADLRLIDAVAPYDSARWYLATACQPCGTDARTRIEAARSAPTLTERARLIAEADTALANDVAFIPLARPWRWSLVTPRLRRWQPNARAWHPLNHLLADPT